jgi:hypothetical protein
MLPTCDRCGKSSADPDFGIGQSTVPTEDSPGSILCEGCSHYLRDKQENEERYQLLHKFFHGNNELTPEEKSRLDVLTEKRNKKLAHEIASLRYRTPE